MASNYQTGDVVTGKVAGIQPYGAFIALDKDTQGLVHISEITYGYVKDVNDYLTVGDEVNVKVLDIDEEAGKISLSLRALQQRPQTRREDRPRKSLQDRIDEREPDGFNTLRDKLQDWIRQSGQ
ncbi:S1 domain-containing post-transcriptional regulator GSP13 [Bhargavaea beijingensis]|uniref:S1 domain-containing post-transcriptional regulator GSP13 n=1 Tax=Bhargavaea beijingensis TaxID=426756 RepID=UPI0022248C3E|nr:S1 domain-containing post-transcriptional regulator GSP13 [Bhargavaea beijingensis]MCW1927642.1 S1 domain-containing post-transcriptional regulator GSP13 [Bhargavaea beijingensis]